MWRRSSQLNRQPAILNSGASLAMSLPVEPAGDVSLP